MIRIKNEYLEVQVSDIGAELQSIKDQEGTEYLWQGNPEYWSSRATNLFPFVGRLTEGKYTYEGIEYPMNNHGFCRGRKFQVLRHSDTCVELYIESDQELFTIYPFKFRFAIIYSLEGSKLEINYKVENQDDKSMYFAVGGHPGFHVPTGGAGVFEDYYLEFHEKCDPIRMGTTDTGFLNGVDTPYKLEQGSTIPLTHDLFDNDAIILKDVSKIISLKSHTSAKELEVGYPNMKYLATWHTVKKEAPFLCIEPWTTLPARDGVVEDITTHPDMNTLEAGCTYENKWWIKIK